MAKPEWGTKRICPSCGERFYDLQREQIACPECGTRLDVDDRGRVSAAKPEKRARAAPAAEQADLVDDGDLAVDEAEEDVDDPLLEDEDEDADEPAGPTLSDEDAEDESPATIEPKVLLGDDDDEDETAEGEEDSDLDEDDLDDAPVRGRKG